MQVLSNESAINYQDLVIEIEPIFIECFKREYGISPSKIELKQYLVSISLDNLLIMIEEWKTQLFESYSKSTWIRTITLYIRKLY